MRIANSFTECDFRVCFVMRSLHKEHAQDAACARRVCLSVRNHTHHGNNGNPKFLSSY